LRLVKFILLVRKVTVDWVAVLGDTPFDLIDCALATQRPFIPHTASELVVRAGEIFDGPFIAHTVEPAMLANLVPLRQVKQWIPKTDLSNVACVANVKARGNLAIPVVLLAPARPVPTQRHRF
jgi:hypothetical protein